MLTGVSEGNVNSQLTPAWTLPVTGESNAPVRLPEVICNWTAVGVKLPTASGTHVPLHRPSFSDTSETPLAS